MDFFSKFKKTDEANPTSDDQEPADSSSYATETTAATDSTYSSTGDVIKAGADASDEYDQKPAVSYNGDDTTGGGYSDKPSDAVGTYANDQSGGGYGRDDTEEGYSKNNLSHGGATTGSTDEYEQQPEGGYGGDKPSSYGGATTETDEYQKPEGGGYGEDTEESFFKKPTYGGSTADQEEEEAAEDLSEKPSGTETDNYGSTEGYDGDATESTYIKKPSGGYGDTTGDYHASADNY